MTVQLIKLVSSQYIPQGVTKMFNSAGVSIIDRFTVFNTSPNDLLTVQVWLNNNGESPADTNLIAEQAIEPRESVSITEAEGHVLLNNDEIFTQASVGDQLSIRVSGRVVVVE